MSGKFQWDANKAKSNKKKHGISFIEATSVFKDVNHVTNQDTRHDYGEERFNTSGRISAGIVNVVHTPRGDETRIISARKANKKEKKWYHLGY